jgi:FkbM family methyltransferase
MAMLSARIVGQQNVITFEGNPQMVDHAKKNFALNGLSGIRIENAVLQNASKWGGAGHTLEFHVTRHFWGSHLAPPGKSAPASNVVAVHEVPTLCLEDIIRESNSNVLICDIEGGEIDLLFEADLSAIDTIMMEIHYGPAGEGPTNRLIKRLINRGFSLDLEETGKGVLLLHRGFLRKKTPATVS